MRLNIHTHWSFTNVVVLLPSEQFTYMKKAEVELYGYGLHTPAVDGAVLRRWRPAGTLEHKYPTSWSRCQLPRLNTPSNNANLTKDENLCQHVVAAYKLLT